MKDCEVKLIKNSGVSEDVLMLIQVKGDGKPFFSHLYFRKAQEEYIFTLHSHMCKPVQGCVSRAF